MAGDVASPSLGTFSEVPAKEGFGSKALGLARKYWYVTLALVIVVGFLIYTFVRNSSAQVGTANTTATTGTTNGTVDGTGVIIAPLPAVPLDPGILPSRDPVNQSPSQVNPTWAARAGFPIFSAANPQGIPLSRAANQSPLAIGGPPASGPAVPFGTHAMPHDPLASSGTMYTRDRSVRVS